MFMVKPESFLGQHSVSARPRLDENLTSYIFRLAHRRRLSTAHALAHSVGLTRFTNRPPRVCLEALATSAEVALEELEAIAYGPRSRLIGWFRGVELPANMFETQRGAERRLCPLCLRDLRHHRAVWDMVFVSACPVHAVRLIDSCQTCGKALKWMGNDLTRCICTADLTRMTAERLPEVDLRGTRVVYGLLGDGSFKVDAVYVRGLAPFQDLQPGRILEFLFRAGLELVAGRRDVFSVERLGELAWEAHTALSRGLGVAGGWPGAFFELLELIHVRSGRHSTTGLTGSVGAVDRWLMSMPYNSGVTIRRTLSEFRAVMHARRVQGEDV
jgi:hypothetical protein